MPRGQLKGDDLPPWPTPAWSRPHQGQPETGPTGASEYVTASLVTCWQTDFRRRNRKRKRKSHLEDRVSFLASNHTRGASQGAPVVKNLPASAKDAGVIPGPGRSPGAGHGNPLQCSCLENPMDKGAWWATVHEVVKSRPQLSTHTKLH